MSICFVRLCVCVCVCVCSDLADKLASFVCFFTSLADNLEIEDRQTYS